MVIEMRRPKNKKYDQQRLFRVMEMAIWAHQLFLNASIYPRTTEAKNVLKTYILAVTI